MTKKDFELIANTLLAARWEGPTSTGRNYIDYDTYPPLVNDFADALATANPRFDRVRFLKACGITERHS